MFFSADLLAHKKSPFSRIWLLGCSSKIVRADLKLDVQKIADAILEWICREDSRRLSLALSATLTYGIARTVREQIRQLQKDVFRVEVDLARSLKLAQTLNEPEIDLTKRMNNVDVTIPSMDDEGERMAQLGNETSLFSSLEFLRHQVPNDQITLREIEHGFEDGGAGLRFEDDEFEDNFGEDPTGSRIK